MSDRVKEDIALAGAVSSGVGKSCEFFIDEYTDLVLSRVWNLSKTHCGHLDRERVCSLVILQKQRKGADYFVDDQCDDCLDSYIWFFDFLKKKVKAYKGTNNCTLKTFVWSVINSNSTYLEWLRWKYGRAF
ncbi:MAG: hypothetical protein HZC49_13015 [Nitrospirae bacterium]|nr:hypothetical protein [Nitrospirota bacterium]